MAFLRHKRTARKSREQECRNRESRSARIEKGRENRQNGRKENACHTKKYKCARSICTDLCMKTLHFKAASAASKCRFLKPNERAEKGDPVYPSKAISVRFFITIRTESSGFCHGLNRKKGKHCKKWAKPFHLTIRHK